jgi:hypothetical protein
MRGPTSPSVTTLLNLIAVAAAVVGAMVLVLFFLGPRE